MSTLPRDASGSARAGHPVPVMIDVPSAGQFDGIVRDFLVAADELGMSSPPETELRDLCRKVAALSVDIFSDQMTVEVRSDPEIPGEIHFTFDVAATGGADEIAPRSNQWHSRLRQMIGKQAELFCLSLNVR